MEIGWVRLARRHASWRRHADLKLFSRILARSLLSLAAALAAAAASGLGGTALGVALLEKLLVGGLLGHSTLASAPLEHSAAALVLLGERSHKALDLRSLDDGLLGTLFVGLLALGLEGGLALNNVLAHIVGLFESEKLADLGRTLRAKADGVGDALLGETGDRGGANLDHNEVDDRKVGADNAATDGLALALASAAGAVARLALLEEKAHTAGQEHTLLHGETLGVVATGDAEDVSSELGVLHVITVDLGRHALVVEASPITPRMTVNRFAGTNTNDTQHRNKHIQESKQGH